MRSNTCPKCQGSMTEGFTLVATDGGSKAASWLEGAPDKRWYGIKVGRKAQHEIQTWRCGRCGFLESYARG
jgi:ribosomal protein S27AE